MLQKLNAWSFIRGLIVVVALGGLSGVAMSEVTAPAGFLSYQYSMKAQGMGVFGIALPNDTAASIANPALPKSYAGSLFTCFVGKYYWDDSLSSITFSKQLPDFPLNVGFQFLRSSSPGIELFAANDQPQGVIEAVQQCLFLSLGMPLNAWTRAGLRIGVLQEDFERYHDQTVFFDAGYFVTPIDAIQAGFVLTNITGSRLGKDFLSSSFVPGLTCCLGPVTVAFEYSLPPWPHQAAGLALALSESCELRAGSADGTSRAGVGLSIGNTTLDYAYKPHVLGDSHFFSLSFRL